MASGVERRRDRLAWLRLRGQVGRFCRFRGARELVLLSVLLVVPCSAWGGNISLTLTGGINFLDASPDFEPVLGPELVALEVKAVGRRDVPWTLTLMADSDFRSGSDVIPISTVSWNAFPDPPYMSGTLSTATPTLIAMGVTHEFTTVNFEFLMQNSWSYNVGTYTATATFTLAAP